MIGIRRILIGAFCLALSASTAGAYYHFYHYTNRSAPYNPVPEKFDLNALPNKTVTFFIADSAAGLITPSTQFASALAAIKDGARAWNAVDSSDLRVVFGGLATSNTPQNTPGADIIFDELDPLTLGLTSTNAAQNAFVSGPGGTFVPIRRPLVRLNRNLGNWTTDPSQAEGFFLTVAHEMGHALGLQHTFTSSLMSTEAAGRATSLYSPLTADDVAGISYLYPRGNLAQSSGSIAGRITSPGGQGIHMASVVAIRATGPAVSALTDPDGRYRIDGIPAGQYVLYVHPVPPSSRAGAAPGDITLPVGADGRAVAAAGPFDTMFYQGGQGTRDFNAASPLNVNPGSLTDNINLSLNSRSTYSIPSVATYSYPDSQTPVRPGFLLNGGGTLVASGTGLTTNGAPTPGLAVNFLGGAPSSTGLNVYNGVYLALNLVPGTAFFASGPRQLVFSLPTDIFVLPSGLNMVQSPPPFISSATAGIEPNGSRNLSLAGTTLFSDTKFYLDGVAANLLRFDQQGRAVIALPAGVAGRRSLLTAFTPDGQNSMFLESANPVTYTYDSGDPGFANFAPNALQAGTETMVEINGSGGSFADGLTTIGFGSSDVQIRRMWVLSPNKIWANVWVSPNAATTSTLSSVITGFQVISQPFAFQLQPATPGKPILSSQVTNASAGQTALYSGAAVILSGANLANANITVGDRQAAIVSANSSQVTFVIPQGLPTGPAALKFTNGADTVAIVIQIDPTPPNVQSVAGVDNITINASRPARPGDVLNVLVSGLANGSVAPDPKHVQVSIAGVNHTPQGILPVGAAHQVQVVLSPAVISGQVPLTVSTDGRGSSAYYMPVVR